ncbi:hypothetical protein EBT31_17605 [bacterium]|nr:hypothetical protein [bacterium]
MQIILTRGQERYMLLTAAENRLLSTCYTRGPGHDPIMEEVVYPDQGTYQSAIRIAVRNLRWMRHQGWVHPLEVTVNVALPDMLVRYYQPLGFIPPQLEYAAENNQAMMLESRSGMPVYICYTEHGDVEMYDVFWRLGPSKDTTVAYMDRFPQIANNIRMLFAKTRHVCVRATLIAQGTDGTDSPGMAYRFANTQTIREAEQLQNAHGEAIVILEDLLWEQDTDWAQSPWPLRFERLQALAGGVRHTRSYVFLPEVISWAEVANHPTRIIDGEDGAFYQRMMAVRKARGVAAIRVMADQHIAVSARVAPCSWECGRLSSDPWMYVMLEAPDTNDPACVAVSSEDGEVYDLSDLMDAGWDPAEISIQDQTWKELPYTLAVLRHDGIYEHHGVVSCGLGVATLDTKLPAVGIVYLGSRYGTITELLDDAGSVEEVLDDNPLEASLVSMPKL